MRRVVLIATIAVMALLASGSASARSQASCSSTMTISGKKLIVIGTAVNCATAKSIVRGLFNAPSIGTQKIGPLTLIKLRSPRAGWKCITTLPIRSKGAGCSKTGTNLRVIYVNISG
ncbi:MAG: hypothetical protein LH654_15315 [Thermoleophilia bacterium]|nr:hypothetical protein [Thermoleophilia bacterium]